MNNNLENAVVESDLERVTLLLSKCADPNERKNEECETLLHKALNEPEKNRKIIEVLLDSGASVNETYTQYGCHHTFSQTVFQKAIRSCLSRDDGDLLALFLRHGGKPSDHSHNTSGGMRSDHSRSFTPLHTATQGKAIKCVRVLLEAKANVEETQRFRGGSEFGDYEDTEETALHIAVAQKNEPMVNLLVTMRADVDRKRSFVKSELIDDNIGFRGKGEPRSNYFESNIKNVKVMETPLHMALLAKSESIVSLLIHSRADPSIPYSEDSIPKATSVLCLEQGLSESLLSLTFAKDTFKYDPPPVRSAIKTLLLCGHRQRWNLPNEVNERIYHFVVKDWEDMEERKRRKLENEKQKKEQEQDDILW